MADAVGQAEVGKEGKGPAGMTCLVYKGMEEVESKSWDKIHPTWGRTTLSVTPVGREGLSRPMGNRLVAEGNFAQCAFGSLPLSPPLPLRQQCP